VLFVRANKDLTVDMVWSSLILALVGEQLDPENNVTGIVVSSRPRMDRVQLWTRIKDDIAAVNTIGNRILETIGFDTQDQQTISLEFQVRSAEIVGC
jgi:translation initiation factor 4E